MIELYLLQQLDAFARLGTLTDAAEELHISQPALTRSMKKLESDLGIALFHRDKRKLTLNAAGRVAAEYARRILEDEDAMLFGIYEADRRDRTLTLGSCGILAINHLIPILTQSFPGKSILTETADDAALISRLKNRGCQLAVLHEKPADRSVYCQRYLTEQIVISVPEAHPLAQKADLKKEDLAGCSLLTFDVGFWVPLFKREMPDTSFFVQTDVDAMDELVDASSLRVFNSDQMLLDGYVPRGRKNLPLREVFAQATYYVACLDAERDRYASCFNAIRAEVIGQQL